jgi:glycosyltransferase involved in cell wall biosynthesis
LNAPNYSIRAISETNFVTNSEKDIEEKIRPYIVACIPAYNEAQTIGNVVLSVKEYVDEVIVCDDGSNDLTYEIAEDLGATLIRHEKNQGYGASINSLFNQAIKTDADYIITIDGDGQHQALDILTLLDRIKQGDVDIVIGSRFVKGGKTEAPSWRNIGIKVISTFASKGGAKITDAQSGLRVYTREAIMSLNLAEQGMGISTEIIMKSRDKNLRIEEVPISVLYRKKTTTRSPFSQGFSVLFSTFKFLSIRKPLLSYSLPGFVSFCISLIFWIWALDIFAKTSSLVTNITLIAIGTSVIGLMLMTAGLILWVTISVVREKNPT